MSLKNTPIKREDIKFRTEKEGHFVEIREEVMGMVLEAVKDAHIVFLKSLDCNRKNVEKALLGIITFAKQKDAETKDDLSEYLEKEYKDSRLKSLYKKEFETIEYSHKIMQLRKKFGLTQKELAKRFGTTQSVISRMESEGYKPSTKTLEKIAKVLKVDVKELLG